MFLQLLHCDLQGVVMCHHARARVCEHVVLRCYTIYVICARFTG